MSNLSNHSPNMVMSRDPGLKLRKFLFFARFCIEFLENVTTFGDIGLKKVTGEKQIGGGGGGGKHPPMLIELRKFMKICS